jgi:hypothetical protein
MRRVRITLCDVVGTTRSGVAIGLDVIKFSDSGIRAFVNSKVPAEVGSGTTAAECGTDLAERNALGE